MPVSVCGFLKIPAQRRQALRAALHDAEDVRAVQPFDVAEVTLVHTLDGAVLLRLLDKACQPIAQRQRTAGRQRPHYFLCIGEVECHRQFGIQRAPGIEIHAVDDDCVVLACLQLRQQFVRPDVFQGGPCEPGVFSLQAHQHGRMTRTDDQRQFLAGQVGDAARCRVAGAIHDMDRCFEYHRAGDQASILDHGLRQGRRREVDLMRVEQSEQGFRPGFFRPGERPVL